jgi:SAM-dependent methyltransferase
MAGNTWEQYYSQTFSQPPRKHLVDTIGLIKNKEVKVAVDCGCGAGRDTIFLLENGFNVIAFDQEESAISYLKRKVEPKLHGQLDCCVSSFYDFHFPDCDLLNASFSLFFTEKADFPEIWNKIESSIKTNGFFCGNFMGPDDTWAKISEKPLNYHSKAEVLNLLKGFNVKSFLEKNEHGLAANGTSKNWHIFTVIAQKV